VHARLGLALREVGMRGLVLDGALLIT